MCSCILDSSAAGMRQTMQFDIDEGPCYTGCTCLTPANLFEAMFKSLLQLVSTAEELRALSRAMLV